MTVLGICICGLNGSGKTTLGKALAKTLNCRAMDVEDYYFPDATLPFSSPRSREEVERLVLADIRQSKRFVFSAVCGDMGEETVTHYHLVVYLSAPRELRMTRIRGRAYDRFGDRILPGGDMHEQEENFFAFAAGRTPDRIEAWLATLTCPILRLDGAKSIETSVAEILTYMREKRLVP